jgi:hypothetical protein
MADRAAIADPNCIFFPIIADDDAFFEGVDDGTFLQGRAAAEEKLTAFIGANCRTRRY